MPEHWETGCQSVVFDENMAIIMCHGERNTPWIVQLKPVRILSRRSDQEYRPRMPWHIFIESSERMSKVIVVSAARDK